MNFLLECLERQRAAYLAHPVPSLDARLADLHQLVRFVRENQDAIVAAISADYGHRSRHETLLTEIGPFLGGVRHVSANLKRWMKPRDAISIALPTVSAATA